MPRESVTDVTSLQSRNTMHDGHVPKRSAVRALFSTMSASRKSEAYVNFVDNHWR